MARSAFRREQGQVAMAMAAALVVTVAVLGMAMVEGRTDAEAPFIHRLRFALRADALVLIWLAAATANVARLRFFSERDIAGSSAGAGSDRIRVAAAILQNTLEQGVLAIGAHLIAAATFDRSDALISALVCLFVSGRLLFWAGYGRGAAGRAFGFALTFYPSILILLASIVAILRA